MYCIRKIYKCQEEIAKLIGYENMEVNCAIFISYADENPESRPRNELDEILEWYE